MPSHIQLEPAYLLVVRPYRETSVLLEAFTATHGRVGLVARGVRSAKSRLRGALQPFAPLLLSWRGGGELSTLSAAEARAAPLPLAGERIFYGWYLNELLLRLLQRDDPHPSLFAVYEALLPELAGSDVQAEAALRIFEKRLLDNIGYGLLLPVMLDARARYHYDWECGPLPQPSPADVTADAADYVGSSLIALRDERLADPVARRDARRLLARALRRQLGERELQSAQLLRQMRVRRGT